MHFNISLDGTEPNALVQKAVNALLAYMTGFPTAEAAAPVAPVSEAPKASKAKRQKVQAEDAAAPWTEPAETATADQSAVIAEAKAQAAEELEAAVQVAESQIAPEVSVVDIRAFAAKFNTDANREIAKGILRKHDAASVSALEERDNIVRVSVMRDLQAAYEKLNQE